MITTAFARNDKSLIRRPDSGDRNAEARRKLKLPANLKRKLHPDTIRRLQDKFLQFDVDGSGTIDRNELCMLLRSTGMNPPQSYLQDLFEKYDADGNNLLTFGEFAQMWHAVGEEFAGEDELGLVEQAFRFFDRDGGGQIEKNEFKAMMLELGDPLTEAEIEEFFAAVDQDNDGRMSYEEFVEFLRKDIAEAEKEGLRWQAPPTDEGFDIGEDEEDLFESEPEETERPPMRCFGGRIMPCGKGQVAVDTTISADPSHVGSKSGAGNGRAPVVRRDETLDASATASAQSRPSPQAVTEGAASTSAGVGPVLLGRAQAPAAGGWDDDDRILSGSQTGVWGFSGVEGHIASSSDDWRRPSREYYRGGAGLRGQLFQGSGEGGGEAVGLSRGHQSLPPGLVASDGDGEESDPSGALREAPSQHLDDDALNPQPVQSDRQQHRHREGSWDEDGGDPTGGCWDIEAAATALSPVAEHPSQEQRNQQAPQVGPDDSQQRGSWLSWLLWPSGQKS